MNFLFSFFLCYFVYSENDLWQEQNEFYLDSGTNVTCLPLTTAYQSICTGATCQIIIKSFHHIGYTQVIYSFNLYYIGSHQIKFSGNGQLILKQYLVTNSNINKFLYCNSNYDVEYFKLISNLTQNANLITFSITSDNPNQFIITTLKIYVHQCDKHCLICNNLNLCNQCQLNFKVSSRQICKCSFPTPYLFQDQCINKCLKGYYTLIHSCIPYDKSENIIFDDQASQFILIKDFNTTDRITSFIDNGKMLAGKFIQNEAIIYTLNQSIDTVTNLHLSFEIFIINLEEISILSLKI